MKTSLKTEYYNLVKKYGSYNMNIIFKGLEEYADVRSYTTKKAVINEINNILFE